MKQKRAIVKMHDVHQINQVMNHEVENMQRLRTYVSDIKIHMINETNFCDVASLDPVHQDSVAHRAKG